MNDPFEGEVETVEPIDGVIIDPTTGEVVQPDDVDELIEALERIRAAEKFQTIAKRQIVDILQSMTEGDAKTRRLRGKTRQVKVVMPDASWDQGVLKEAYHAYPKFRDEFLRIERLGVKMREWKKATFSTGPDEFNWFLSLVAAAERAPTANATITVEE